MLQYALKRLLLAIPTIFAVTILTFVGLRIVVPVHVTDFLLSLYQTDDPVIKKQLEANLGLSGSIPKQYAEWVGLAWFINGDTGLLQGDLGKSYYSKTSVTAEITRRAPVSLELGLLGQISAIMVSVPMGVWAAVRQDKLPDYGLRSLAILLNAVPSFWIAILILTFGSIWFQWSPPISFRYLTEDPIAHLKIMLLPGLIISLTPSGGLLRLVRTQMLEVLRQDYVRTARAKGLSNNTVLFKHALRNSLLPVVTVIGVGLPNIIAGSVIFEQIFVIPGMGKYLLTAVNNLDYPVIQGLNFVFATLLIFAVILVDITYAILDPRVRIGRN